MSAHGAKYILAIDLGTSGPKVALVSTHGELLASAYEATPLLLLPHGGAEHRPDDWWTAVVTAARRVLGEKLVPVEDILAISCASLYSTTLPVGGDGRPLMNALSWMDTRGAPHVQAITGGRLQVEGYAIGKLLTWLRLTGGVPTHSGKDSLAHILYLKHELPEVYRAAHKFLEPKDYLNLRLTGKFAATFDSINLHWLTDNRDIARITYSDELLRLTGLAGAKLPDLKRATDILGPVCPEAAAELGLPATVQVVAGLTDAQAAAIGAGAVEDYQAHLYLGTSSWLSCHVPFKRTDLFHNMACLPSAVPGRYYIANEQECAGVCLTFLRDNLLFPDDALAASAAPPDAYQVFDRVAERVPAGGGRLLFAPWLYGERTPVEDHTVRGGFFNLSLKTTREHLVRAVFEGVAFNTRWMFGPVERLAGRRLEPITVIGGGAKSDIWCQIYADVLDREIHQAQDPLWANARGAAFLAAVALGQLRFADIPGRRRIARAYRPIPAHRQIYDELFGEFIHLYRNNRRSYARLNRALASAGPA